MNFFVLSKLDPNFLIAWFKNINFMALIEANGMAVVLCIVVCIIRPRVSR